MANRRDLDATSSRVVDVLRFGGLGLLILFLLIVWVSLHGAAAWNDAPRPPSNPFELVLDLASGHEQVSWSQEATILAVVQVTALAALAATVAWILSRRHRRQLRPDRAAAQLATRRDLQPLTAAGARKTADRLQVPSTAAPGVPLGRALPSRIRLYSNWESMLVVVAGPRTMKSTAYAIPAIIAAPGAVLATSNKRDVVDTTRGLRADLGQVWVFDPQNIAPSAGTAEAGGPGSTRTWWWNPLTYIAPFDPATGRAMRDPHSGWVLASEARAEKLAGQFCASAITAGARTDAYFDSEAENLIGLMLLASACGEEPITRIYTWLATASDDLPVSHLRDNGLTLHAQSLNALANLPDKQREGVYGTARSRMGFLRNRDMVSWIIPPTDPRTASVVRQFHPPEFATSSDTLYPLSKEGEGSAGPLVAALTVAVVDELEEQAAASGGRLPVPFLAVLDEAANICRFRNLDSYYSHFGSRGIIIMTILQNWAQGEEVWGAKGMEKLWSAANVKVYGGGVDDDRFLRRISDLIGSHTYITRSGSTSHGGRRSVSVSSSVQERTILTIAELRELPTGRAVAFASGTPAVLIEPEPWFRGAHAAAIERSRAAQQSAIESTTRLEAVDQSPGTSAGAPPPAVTHSPWDVKAIDQ